MHKKHKYCAVTFSTYRVDKAPLWWCSQPPEGGGHKPKAGEHSPHLDRRATRHNGVVRPQQEVGLPIVKAERLGSELTEPPR